MPHSIETIAAVFFAIAVCYLLSWTDAYHSALITVAVVVVIGQVVPGISVWFNACSRLMESIIGIGITLLVVLILYPVRKALHLITESKSV
mgnify:CR=1 FL=1